MIFFDLMPGHLFVITFIKMLKVIFSYLRGHLKIMKNGKFVL